MPGVFKLNFFFSGDKTTKQLLLPSLCGQKTKKYRKSLELAKLALITNLIGLLGWEGKMVRPVTFHVLLRFTTLL